MRRTNAWCLLTGLALLALASSASAGVALFGRQTDTIQVSDQTVFGTASTYEAVILFPSALYSGGRVFNEWQGFAEDKFFGVVPGPSGAVQGFNYPLSGTLLSATAAISFDQWHHLAYVYDGSEERLYLDGSLLQSRATSGDVNDSAGSIAHVGAIFRDNALQISFVGLIDVLRLSDVARYAGSSFTPPSPDLTSDMNTVLLYTFDETPGSQTVADGSSLGRTGTPAAGFDGATSPSFCGADTTDDDADWIPDACDPDPPASTTTSTSTLATTSSSTTSTSSTTSSSSTTTTSSLPAATTTTSTAPVATTTTTTTTTLPQATCGDVPAGPTFASIACRLDALIARAGVPDLGAVQAKVVDQLGKARAKVDQALSLCAQASRRKTRNALRPAIQKLAQARRTLGSRPARRVPQALRDELGATAEAIRGDMRELQRVVACPEDAG